MPKTRTEWWQQKIRGTLERDKIAEISLTILGWRVVQIWECQIKQGETPSIIASVLSKT
jgi:DNA mismatch endonuclease (patch repair protein)